MATDWLTTREAAGLCRLSVSRFNELAAASRLPRGGRKVRLYDRTVLDTWIRHGMRAENEVRGLTTPENIRLAPNRRRDTGA